MNRSLLSLASFALLLSTPTLAEAEEGSLAPRAVARDVAMEPAARPECVVSSPSASWRIPVNVPSVPFAVWETGGARTTLAVTVTPQTKVDIVADTTSGSPASSRRLVFGEAKAGDVFDVSIAGNCIGGTTPNAVALHVEFVAAAPLPTTLGTLTEAPLGRTLLTLDPAFAPFIPQTTLSFGTFGSYAAGRTVHDGDTYGVLACVGGACGESGAAVPNVPPASSPLVVLAANVCSRGRSTGMVTLDVVAKASIVGVDTSPLEAKGVLHVDCTKATEGELATTMPATGCSISPSERDARTTCATLASVAFAGLLARRRRRSRPDNAV
ncbi:MAG: hypothetical protein U0174_18505 [Polyangiaceae bacterium]